MVKNRVLRIRNDAIIHKLDIPNDKLEVMQKILRSKVMDKTRQAIIRKLSEGSPCCVCGGIPVYEVHYSITDGGATRIERYCSKCIEKV